MQTDHVNTRMMAHDIWMHTTHLQRAWGNRDDWWKNKKSRCAEQNSQMVKCIFEHGEQTLLILYASCVPNIPPHLFRWHKNLVIKCDFCHLSDSNKWNANKQSEGALSSLTSVPTDRRVGQKRGERKKIKTPDRCFLDQSWPDAEWTLRCGIIQKIYRPSKGAFRPEEMCWGKCPV